MRTLRLVTANLYNGKARPGAVADILDEWQPDLMAVQELAPNVVDVIAERLPFGMLVAKGDYHGGGIAARRPMVVEPMPVAVRHGWSARLRPADWPEVVADTEIVSMHLINPLEGLPWTSTAVRSSQLAGLKRHLDRAPTMRRVVVGDMNASPAWPAYRKLAGWLTDGVREAGEAKRTWGPWWWFPRLLRIDHVLTSGVRVAAVRRVTVRGSDHSALVVDLDYGTADGSVNPSG